MEATHARYWIFLVECRVCRVRSRLGAVPVRPGAGRDAAVREFLKGDAPVEWTCSGCGSANTSRAPEIIVLESETPHWP
jgi:hypothetical protein